MVLLAAIIASQALGEYKVMVAAALNIGVTPIEIKEILYQSVPYVGIAKVFDFLHATNAVLKEKGIALPLDGQSTTTPKTRYTKGLAAQKAIFGDIIERMRQKSPSDQLHIQDFLAANCFGDYYTRSGLDLKTRELLTFAMLISLGGCEPQVKGHVTGNILLGNDRARLIDVTTQLLPYIGYPRTLNALRVIDEVAPLLAATAN
jgi:4-carboxymuconolactone decarboxylase